MTTLAIPIDITEDVLDHIKEQINNVGYEKELVSADTLVTGVCFEKC